MKIETQNIYHIYNQGNNRQQIYFTREHCLLFLKPYRKQIAAHCETLCYCLMPNHFRFLVYATDKSVVETKLGVITIQKLSDGFRRLLSTYAHEINSLQGTVGSLFRQKTQAKLTRNVISTSTVSYAEQCFYYIHQNPVSAGLAETISDWEFSSAQDFSGLRNGTLCNQQLAFQLFGWRENDLTFLNRTYNLDKETETSFFEFKVASDQGQTE